MRSFNLTPTPISFTKPTKNLIFSKPRHLLLHRTCLQSKKFRRMELLIPGISSSVPYQSINVDYFEQEFSGHGVTFEGIGEDCIARLRLESGATATLLLPSGIITSYKASMWHGGTLELLHSSVTEAENGEAHIQGGISLALNCEVSESNNTSWVPRNWILHTIRGNPSDSIQVELKGSDSEDMVEVKYIVTLREDMLSSELVISNSKPKPLRLKGSILSHLTVSTPDATYVIGLERSNFFSRLPFSSDFGIIPPDFGEDNRFDLGQKLKGLFLWNSKEKDNTNEGETSQRESEEEIEGEESDNYKHLTKKMSRIYTGAPRNFTVIDRGRRNSVVVGRDGFEELYMLSPGSDHEFYGKYAFICVGQAALLKPIVLGPEQVWRGGQHLYNPNL